MAICKRCKEEKPISEFGKNRVSKDGAFSTVKMYWCEDCVKKNRRQWYRDNINHVKKYNKQYRKDNHEYILKYEKQYRKRLKGSMADSKDRKI